MNTLNSRNLQVTAKKSDDIDINCSIPFLQHSDRRAQNLLVDIPNELYYNPSTKTLHADNFSGAHINLIEGEAVQISHNTTNNTT